MDLGTGIAAVQKAIDELHLPKSIRVEYGGQYEEQQKSFGDLLRVLLLALLLLFGVLLLEFRTFSAPTAILCPHHADGDDRFHFSTLLEIVMSRAPECRPNRAACM